MFTNSSRNSLLTEIQNNQHPRRKSTQRTSRLQKGIFSRDHLRVENQVIEKCREYRYLLSLTWSTTTKFYSVEIPEVFEAIREQGVDLVFFGTEFDPPAREACLAVARTGDELMGTVIDVLA